MIDNRVIHIDSGEGFPLCQLGWADKRRTKHPRLNTDQEHKWRGKSPIDGVIGCLKCMNKFNTKGK